MGCPGARRLARAIALRDHGEQGRHVQARDRLRVSRAHSNCGGRSPRKCTLARSQGMALAVMAFIVMQQQHPTKHAPSFTKSHGWVTEGRKLSARLLWSLLPGILVITAIAALFLIFGNSPTVAGWLGPKGRDILHAAGLGLLSATGIGFLIITAVQSQRRFRDHLRHGELTFAQTEAILSAGHDGVVVMDIHGRLQSLNPAAEKMFGLTTAKVLGQNVTLLMPDRAIWQDLTGLPRSLTATGQRPGAQSFPIELNLHELILDSRRLVVALVRDASDSGRGSEALQKVGVAMAPTPGFFGQSLRVCDIAGADYHAATKNFTSPIFVASASKTSINFAPIALRFSSGSVTSFSTA